MARPINPHALGDGVRGLFETGPESDTPVIRLCRDPITWVDGERRPGDDPQKVPPGMPRLYMEPGYAMHQLALSHPTAQAVIQICQRSCSSGFLPIVDNRLMSGAEIFQRIHDDYSIPKIETATLFHPANDDFRRETWGGHRAWGDQMIGAGGQIARLLKKGDCTPDEIFGVDIAKECEDPARANICGTGFPSNGFKFEVGDVCDVRPDNPYGRILQAMTSNPYRAMTLSNFGTSVFNFTAPVFDQFLEAHLPYMRKADPSRGRGPDYIVLAVSETRDPGCLGEHYLDNPDVYNAFGAAAVACGLGHFGGYQGIDYSLVKTSMRNAIEERDRIEMIAHFDRPQIAFRSDYNFTGSERSLTRLQTPQQTKQLFIPGGDVLIAMMYRRPTEVTEARFRNIGYNVTRRALPLSAHPNGVDLQKYCLFRLEAA